MKKKTRAFKIKERMGNEGVTPRIHNLGIRLKLAFRFTLQPLYPRRKNFRYTKYEAT
jgi:hypothetical protein